MDPGFNATVPNSTDGQVSLGEEQRKREMVRISQDITQFCFDFCVNNFRTRDVDQIEADCITHCATKYVSTHSRAATVFTNQQLLQMQNQIEQMMAQFK